MTISEQFIAELKHEGANTRKMLERVPEKSYSWKPHDKSMSLGRLAKHLVEIPQWVEASLIKDELDFEVAKYVPTDATSSRELLEFYDKNLSQAMEILRKTPDEEYKKNWTLRSGEQIYVTMPKSAVVRSFIMSHSIHHRAQLSVYLRLLDIPVPGMYGPSADEEM